MYQCGLISYLNEIKPDLVINFANLRYLSFWSTLIWCKFLRIPILLHGHGLYKKRNVSLFWKLIYRLILRFSSVYICYTQSGSESLLRLGLPKKKIAVAENSLINPYPVSPENKTGKENGILFIGRLREGCRLDWLINAVGHLRAEKNVNMNLHIIGDGVNRDIYHKISNGMSWIKFYGPIYDMKKISKISQKCIAGCYPGNAGLSLVHLMSLSLPPITHDDMIKQGPEASYLLHGINGILFPHKSAQAGLISALHSIVHSPKVLYKLQVGAYRTYENLSKPSLSIRLEKIIKQFCC